MYIGNMQDLSNNYHFNFLNHLGIRKNTNQHYILLKVIGTFFLNEKLPPINKRKLIKKPQEKRYEMKGSIKTANQSCND